jgi:hypothetical protein
VKTEHQQDTRTRKAGEQAHLHKNETEAIPGRRGSSDL